ncbi:MAG TPA: type IV pilus twitching motility protein PilT [Candidatus Eisenbacteria bacterium]|jgi:twitching motility protein PilT|nr:type IV pilus twitching motility protein PilT [Candidatus Eisenbacteria bacterium]
MNLRPLLETMLETRASDLHVKVGASPLVRVDGSLFAIDTNEVPSQQDIEDWMSQLLTDRQKKEYEEHRELDFSFGVAGLARFRANAFVQRGTLAMAFRAIPVEIPPFEALGLPLSVREQAFQPRGLVLVTGPTGVGKSTTLAALVDAVNRDMAKNVITIEDPIEFLHRDRMSCIHQREVGVDTYTFEDGLRHILRQDPDVILVGEIRDRVTMETVLMASDTGHLVLSTLHTTDCLQTIQRVISFFPPHQHDEIRRSLANNLKAVICQRLIPKVGGGRVLAVEVLVNTPTVFDLILNADKTHQLKQAMQDGVTQYGMQTFDQSVMALFRNGVIAEEDALRHCSNPSEFQLHLRGIQATSDRRWQPVDRGVLEHNTKPSSTGIGGGTNDWQVRE